MQKVLKELFDQFVKKNGREPDNLEMILIRQKASTQEVNKRKIISMFDRSPVDADKPILGGQNIQETDAQILERLNKGNEDSLNRLKNKKDEPDEMATGGRAGYYGGGQAMVEPDLSDIGHGSDALMGRTRLTAPGSQATTSTGLNYLLGEDNDNVRVPFNEGLLVPPKKPYTKEMFQDDSMTLLQGMHGTGKDSNKFLYNEMIKKGNILRKQGVERETVIEIIKNNKDKIDMILKKQIGDKKSLAGLADGGPARQNFKMGRRAFLGLMGSVGAGIASLKSGLLGFTKGGGKKVAKEVVKEATGGPPVYFFKLVDKIRKLGDDVTETGAIAERQSVKQYKDFTLTEDTATGRIEIQKVKNDAGEAFGKDNFGNGLTEEVYMGYSPNETIIVKGKPVEIGPQYDEGTAYLRNDGPNTGDIYEEVSGVTDDIFEEVGEEIPEILRKEKADGGRIGYAGGKKVVDAIIKKVNKKSGKKAVTTADKAEIPKETLLRDMFKKFDNRNPDPKRIMTADEYEDFIEEVGGADQLEAYNFNGTVGDAQRILKEQENNMAYMYEQYRMGKLDPVAGDKSPARKKFLEKKLEEMEASGDKKLMTRDEIEELSTFDLGTQMDEIDISQGMIDLDELNFTKNAQAAKKAIDDTSEVDMLMKKYPGMNKELAEQIATSEPIKKADIIAMVEQTFKMSEKGMSGDDIIQTFKNTTRTKQATGGLASILG